MNLQKLLGELFTPEIKSKLEGIELVDKSDFSDFIPKERFDKINTEKNDFKKQANDYKKEVDKLSKGTESVDDIKKQLDLKTKEFEEYQESIVIAETNSKKTTAIINDLTAMNALNPKLLAKEFNLDQVSFDDNGKLVGVKDTFEKLKTDYAQQFGKVSTETPPPNEGGGTGITKEAFSKMTYKERVELKTANPTTYETLTK